MAHALSGDLGINLSGTSTTQTFALGTEVSASDGNIYRYVKANGALALGAACVLDEAEEATETLTANLGAVPASLVFPQVAFADNEYGWAVIRGTNFLVKALTLCAADVRLYTTATAGCVDDTATELIQGLRLNSVVGGVTAATSATAPNGAYVNAET